MDQHAQVPWCGRSHQPVCSVDETGTPAAGRQGREPRRGSRAIDEKAARREIPTTLLRGLLNLDVGKGGGRKIDAFSAPLRLINTTWAYDPASHTLFTSDMFAQHSQPNEQGPWVIEHDEVTDDAFLRSFLLNTRYWWLEGAATETLRRAIAGVFERYDIEIIAPGNGAIFKGRELVDKEYSTLDRVLRDLDRSRTRAAYVPRGLER